MENFQIDPELLQQQEAQLGYLMNLPFDRDGVVAISVAHQPIYQLFRNHFGEIYDYPEAGFQDNYLPKLVLVSVCIIMDIVSDMAAVQEPDVTPAQVEIWTNRVDAIVGLGGFHLDWLQLRLLYLAGVANATANQNRIAALEAQLAQLQAQLDYMQAQIPIIQAQFPPIQHEIQQLQNLPPPAHVAQNRFVFHDV